MSGVGENPEKEQATYARRSDVDEQRPLKIQHGDLPPDPIPQTFHEPVESMDEDLPIPEAFLEMVEGKRCTLDHSIHKDKYDELMVDDPKRKARVPSRFCSFHLDGFDLDAMSTAPIGPLYQPTDYAAESARGKLATCGTNVVSVRVVRAGPDYTYPVEVYGKIIARDQVDYKCVYLFDRERKDAQTINSEKDMLALTGPNRALVTLRYMYFEFDLKIKGNDGPDDEVQFSKGVISYFCRFDRKRIILQLPSFKSTVKLVLQHVDLPLAASLEVSVVKQGPSDPPAHFDGKITAGTTRNYRQHMLLYDSTMRRGVLVRGDGTLVLNRNLVAVNRYAQDEEDEKLVLYVCFLDAGCEIEDEDWTYPEDEDSDDDEAEAKEAEEQVEKDPKKCITLKYPLCETVWEHGGLKLRVKVDWTAVLDRPVGTDFFYRHCCLPDGFEPDYRFGVFT